MIRFTNLTTQMVRQSTWAGGDFSVAGDLMLWGGWGAGFAALDVIFGKWKVVILYHLTYDGTDRRRGEEVGGED